MNNRMIMLVLAVALGLVSSGYAGESFFQSNPANLGDLDHYKAYTWGVDLGFSTAEKPITEFSVTFEGIYNYNTAPKVLYIHLLESSEAAGLNVYRDLAAKGDYFDGQGVLIAVWSDSIAVPQTVSFTFDQNLLDILNTYAADGRFAFGFDPDCYYRNDGFTFAASFAPIVPAPAAIVLAGMGTALIGWLRRRTSI